MDFGESIGWMIFHYNFISVDFSVEMQACGINFRTLLHKSQLTIDYDYFAFEIVQLESIGWQYFIGKTLLSYLFKYHVWAV